MLIGTYVYSSHSVDALKKLLSEFFSTFHIDDVTPDDLFYYGVFCKDVTYANYKYWEDAPATLEIPDELTSPCQTEKDRLDYVHIITDMVMKGEFDKPEWMLYVETEETCNECDAAPSTFLRLIPKEGKYQALSERLLGYLYSVNLVNYGYRYHD